MTTASVSEQAIEIGIAPKLSGIIASNGPVAGDTMVLIINAGLVHRVGPFRLHVLLARQLARQGIANLRLDLAGLGYSTARIESAGPIEDAKADALLAMDHLQSQYGCSRFVLIGLCSGAEGAHYIALQDPRVVGCVFLDGYAYPTPRSRFNHYRVRLFKAGIWIDWFRARFLPKKKDEGASPEGGLWEVERPPLERFRAELKQLMVRDVRLLYVFAGISGEYNYAGQMGDGFPEIADSGCSEQLVRQADHTYIVNADRQDLLQRVVRWVAHHFAAP